MLTDKCRDLSVAPIGCFPGNKGFKHITAKKIRQQEGMEALGLREEDCERSINGIVEKAALYSILSLTLANSTSEDPADLDNQLLAPFRANAMDRNLESDRDMEHESDMLQTARSLTRDISTTFQLTPKKKPSFVAPNR